MNSQFQDMPMQEEIRTQDIEILTENLLDTLKEKKQLDFAR